MFQIKVINDSNLCCKDTRPDGWGEEDGTWIAPASCFDGVLQVILQLNQRKLHFVSEGETKKCYLSIIIMFSSFAKIKKAVLEHNALSKQTLHMADTDLDSKQ